MRIAVCALGGLLMLAGCGEVTALKPKPGHDLPVAPYGRADKPGAGELLGQAPQTRPGRTVELRTRSEPRGDDAFDLPPKE
jgi:hypothetical protein